MKKLLVILFAGLLMSCSDENNRTNTTETMNTESEKKIEKKALYPELSNYIASLDQDVERIDPERKELLRELADYVGSERDSGQVAKLTFICTHNSRRSHMSQIWAATMANHFGIEGVETFSGGTEATAFNPRAVAAMERAGFEIDNPGSENPAYKVRFSDDLEPMICFSKKYDDPSNPQKEFAAIMTCSHADETCPFIPGAKFRIPIPYDDPKAADDTPEETTRYDERCRQIAAEMHYLFNRVALEHEG